MLFTKKRIRQIAVVSLVVLIVSLIPILAASFYAHQTHDDFGYSIRVHNAVENGDNIFQLFSEGIKETAERYHTWQGTYSAIFIFSMQPGAFSEKTYFLSTFLILAALIFSTAFLFSTIFKALNLEKEYATIISSIILFLSIQFVYDKSQAFYWWNGASYYTVFYSFALIMFAFLIKLYTEKKKNLRITYLIASLLLAFVIGGGNYSTALCTLVILTLAIALLIKEKKKDAISFSAVFVVLMVGLAISAAAPGNSVRAGLYNGYSPVQAVYQSIANAAHFFYEWAGLPQIAAFTLIAMIVYRLTKRINFDFKYPLAVCILTFLVFATQITPPLYAMGHVGGGRQVNIYYYSYYLVSVINLFYICGWINKQGFFSIHEKKLKPVLYRYIIIAVLIVFSIGCWGHGVKNMTSFDTSIALLDGTAKEYSKEYFETIAEVKRGESVVSEIETVPDFFLDFGLGTSPDYWVNRQISTYYHNDGIVKK